MGVAPIVFVFNGNTFNTSGTVSVQGRCNDGTWLPVVNATTTPASYETLNQVGGFRAVWGRAGGWVTNVLGAGSDRDDLWALNGVNANLTTKAKVVGYQLRTFSYIGDIAFIFDSTI